MRAGRTRGRGRRWLGQNTPGWIVFALAGLGHAPPPAAAGGRWCELGCEPGLGLLLAAAIHPHWHSVGIDVNPSHIRHGSDLAATAGIRNAEFIEVDIRDLGPQRLGTPRNFDVVALQGVYSWVSLDVRRASVRFLADTLARGAWPTCTTSHSGMSVFAAARDPRRAAHDLMGETWEPRHVADVHAEMAGISGHYLGSAVLHEDINAVSLSSDTAALARVEAVPAMTEAIRDFARN